MVKRDAPITGEQIAEWLGVSRPTLRSDLSLLVMLGLLDAKPKVGYFIGNALRRENALLHNAKSLKVGDVQGMSVNIPASFPVHDAVVALFTENADTLLVVNEHKHFVGIVTPKDLLKLTLGNPNAATIPVSMVMTRYPNIITARQDDSVLDAVRKMIAHQVDCLPVVTVDAVSGHAEATGWITKTLVLRILADTSGE